MLMISRPPPTLEQDEAEAQAQQWLQSLASGKPIEDLESRPADEISPDRIEQPVDEPAEALAAPLSDEMPSDPAEAFAWLESLAAQQGADEEAPFYTARRTGQHNAGLAPKHGRRNPSRGTFSRY